MTEMKTFTTKAKRQKDGDRESIKFKFDDQEVTSYRPTEAQVAYLVGIQSGGVSSTDEQVAGIINFFHGMFDDDSARHFRHRLLDREDPFDLEDVQDVLLWLMGEWAERPTKPSSASTSLPENSGADSTETSSSEASTSGPAPQLAPAT